VIVQNWPGIPLYSEQSFATWRFPLRSENAHAGAAPEVIEKMRAAPADNTRAKLAVVSFTCRAFISISFGFDIAPAFPAGDDPRWRTGGASHTNPYRKYKRFG
jgi:hypothetical protein